MVRRLKVRSAEAEVRADERRRLFFRITNHLKNFARDPEAELRKELVEKGARTQFLPHLAKKMTTVNALRAAVVVMGAAYQTHGQVTWARRLAVAIIKNIRDFTIPQSVTSAILNELHDKQKAPETKLPDEVYTQLVQVLESAHPTLFPGLS